MSQLTRSDKVAAVRQCRATFPQMLDRDRAALLGMTYSAYRNLVNDPDGAKQAARRERYRGACEDCGAQTRSDGTSKPSRFCVDCAHRRATVWTRETVIETFRAFYAAVGRPPSVVDMAATAPSIACHLSPERITEAEQVRALVRLPFYPTVRNLFGGWDVALDAAGLPESVCGSPAHRGRREQAAA